MESAVSAVVGADSARAAAPPSCTAKMPNKIDSAVDRALLLKSGPCQHRSPNRSPPVRNNEPVARPTARKRPISARRMNYSASVLAEQEIAEPLMEVTQR